MKNKLVFLAIALLIFSFGGALAQDKKDDQAESTIRLMGAAEAQLPDAVTKEISLPDAAAEDKAAVENAAKGIETSNQNRERREHGLNRADEARERGAEMSEQANENRENRGRSKDRPNPPDPPGQKK